MNEFVVEKEADSSRWLLVSYYDNRLGRKVVAKYVDEKSAIKALPGKIVEHENHIRNCLTGKRINQAFKDQEEYLKNREEEIFQKELLIIKNGYVNGKI